MDFNLLNKTEVLESIWINWGGEKKLFLTITSTNKFRRND